MANLSVNNNGNRNAAAKSNMKFYMTQYYKPEDETTNRSVTELSGVNST